MSAIFTENPNPLSPQNRKLVQLCELLLFLCVYRDQFIHTVDVNSVQMKAALGCGVIIAPSLSDVWIYFQKWSPRVPESNVE